MYSRYIPQPDGSFRRSHVPDRPQPNPPRQNSGQPCPPAQKPVPPPPPPPKPEPCRKRQENRSCDSSVGSFLRQLLPRSLDTGDLLIVMLLLLMAGDSPEDQNTALLTLAIYLFL